VALYTTLASLSQTASANAADGTSDPPSTIDNQLNLLASFLAQVRDGNGLTTGLGYVAQCRLTKSGANLLLSRCNGLGLTINGVAYAIPSAGVTLAPTSLSVGTTYYIYAYMNAGTMTLEASTTTHATDTTTGMEIKSGDATRSLVGMARTITGPAWSDLFAQRFVASYYNRRPIEMRAVLASNQAVSSATFGEISTTLRLEFLQWLGESAPFNFQGSMLGSLANSIYTNQLSYDSATATSESYSDVQAFAANAWMNPACNLIATANSAEGYHLVTPLARQSGGATATYIGSGGSGGRCVVNGVVPL